MSDSARLYRGSLAPDEAVARLTAAVGQADATETVDLATAGGRYLVADLVAGHDLPATNNAAVDGYAVDAGFLASNPAHAFPVIGRAAAGHPFAGQAAPGEAVRTFTGAVMPDGTDAVAMHEFCKLDAGGTSVTIGSKLAPGSNNRPAGENLRKGETIIAAGTRLACRRSRHRGGKRHGRAHRPSPSQGRVDLDGGRARQPRRAAGAWTTS